MKGAIYCSRKCWEADDAAVDGKKFEYQGARYQYTLFNKAPGHGDKYPLLLKRFRPGMAIEQKLVHLDDLSDVTGAVLKNISSWILGG